MNMAVVPRIFASRTSLLNPAMIPMQLISRDAERRNPDDDTDRIERDSMVPPLGARVAQADEDFVGSAMFTFQV